MNRALLNLVLYEDVAKPERNSWYPTGVTQAQRASRARLVTTPVLVPPSRSPQRAALDFPPQQQVHITRPSLPNILYRQVSAPPRAAPRPATPRPAARPDSTLISLFYACRIVIAPSCHPGGGENETGAKRRCTAAESSQRRLLLEFPSNKE